MSKGYYTREVVNHLSASLKGNQGGKKPSTAQARESMWITVEMAFCIGGGRDVEIGDVLNVDKAAALAKIAKHWARLATPDEIRAAVAKVAARQAKEREAMEADAEAMIAEDAEAAEIAAAADHPDVGEPETVATRDPEPVKRGRGRPRKPSQ